MSASQSSVEQFSPHMPPLQMSSREVLDDFIRSLPRSSPYSSFVTEPFGNDSTKWHLHYYSRHKANHKASKNFTFEGICRVWTYKAPLTVVGAYQTVGRRASWTYSVAATVTTRNGERQETLKVHMKTLLDVKPTWDDVVRCLQGVNHKEMRTRYMATQNTPAPTSKILKPVSKQKSIPRKPTPQKTTLPAKTESSVPVTKLDMVLPVPPPRNSADIRQATSFGVTSGGSPFLTKATRPSASPIAHPHSSHVAKSVSQYNSPTNSQPTAQVSRPASSYAVRPATSRSPPIPASILPAPQLPPLGPIPGHSPRHPHKRLGFNNTDFPKYETTAGGGIQTLFPSQYTTQPVSTSRNYSNTLTACQVTDPVRVDGFSGEEVDAISRAVVSYMTRTVESEQGSSKNGM